MMHLIEVFKSSFAERIAEQQEIPEMEMLISFAVVCLLAFYIVFIYKQMSKRGFYNPHFSKTLVTLPVLTTALVFALQLNILVSLGAIGALSIVRFRNAVKDPFDLLFLFWSISVGMLCGTSIYIIAIFASLVITVVLFGLDMRKSSCDAYVLVLECAVDVSESTLLAVIAPFAQKAMIRSNSVTKSGKKLLIELSAVKDQALVNALLAVERVQAVTLVAHDGEVRY